MKILRRHGWRDIDMRLAQMLKDRQEILVLGELVLFLAAWGLGIAAAVDDHRIRTNAKPGNNVAAKADFSGANFMGPSYIDHRGEFE